MRIGPKYKIARRLGASVFDKTQTRKFSEREANRGKEKGKPRAKSDFGLQMLEKQRARYTYGINERQFAKYVKSAIEAKGAESQNKLFENLETRLDNVVYRLGFAPSRQAARQMVSHGHITVNGIKVTIPSFRVSTKDKIKPRAGSMKNKLFQGVNEKLKDVTVPNWMSYNAEKNEAEITAMPKYTTGGAAFDIAAILEFYKR
jgi:small subunit ribosomal protein S4